MHKLNKRQGQSPKSQWDSSSGKSKTIPNEARTIRELFQMHAAGMALPIPRPGIELPQLNAILENTYDLPDPEKYAQADWTEQVETKEYLRTLGAHIKSQVDQQLAEYQQRDKPVPPQDPPQDPPGPPVDPPV